MSSSGDSLKIPIEIKTEDLDEIQKLINEISNAESDLHTIKPRVGKGTGDVSSRSAFARPEADTRGGIFGGQMGEAKPGTPRDNRSKTPYQKESEFAQLRNQVQENTQKAGGMDIAKGTLGGLSQGLGLASTLGTGMSGLSGIASMASKAFLPLAVITTIVELITATMAEWMKPGGRWDRRWRRVLKDEFSASVELAKKQAIGQGSMVVRVETSPGIRGERGLNSSLGNLITNKGVYLNDLHQKAKGLNP